jgi:hypothetical protein
MFVTSSSASLQPTNESAAAAATAAANPACNRTPTWSVTQTGKLHHVTA